MKNKIYKEAFDNILDTMTGMDGGGRFVMLKALLEDISNQADNGDAASKEIMKVVTTFSRLINVAQTPQGRGIDL